MTWLDGISIIIPVLNEGAELAPALQRLQRLRDQGVELVVVDGGSVDNSREIAQRYCDQLLASPRGRAVQMNTGAAAAGGEMLIFLHADTCLPPDALAALAARYRIERRKSPGSGVWGRFDVRLSGSRWPLRVIERMMNWRSRLSGMVTGDQAMFVQTELFRRVDGFPDLALMEDLAISRRLKDRSPPLCLKGPVITSSRRWEQRGIMRTVLLMWRLRLAWYFGADAASLAQRYY